MSYKKLINEIKSKRVRQVIGEKMTPSQRAKELGGKSLAQVAEKTEQSERTLINWFNNPKKRKLFEIVCRGVNKEEEVIWKN